MKRLPKKSLCSITIFVLILGTINVSVGAKFYSVLKGMSANNALKKEPVLNVLDSPSVIEKDNSIMIPSELLDYDMQFKYSPRAVGTTFLTVLTITYTTCSTVNYVTGGFDPCMWLRNKLVQGSIAPGKYRITYETVNQKDPSCQPQHSWQCNKPYTVYHYEKIG